MTKGISERELVLGILLEVTEKGEYSHLVLRSVLEKYQYLEKKERAFITRLAEGTLERMIELDYILDQFSKVKVKKMKPVIRNIMRMAVYQIKYMDAVPDSAACNEAVKLAVKKGFVNLKGFVNGVLRSIVRGLDALSYPKETDTVDYLSVTYSMPEWIVKKWLKTYDCATVEKMLQGFLEEKPTTIRINPTKMEKEELIASLTQAGVEVEQHEYLPYALQISGYDYLADLESFREGAFSVQDISSMMVAQIASPQEADFVIDVCAAPGGKALQMAEMLHGTGHVIARDLTDYKVGLMRENMMRLGLDNISAQVWDATVLDESMVGKADIVIADLPCSGLGVIGKKTDIKYKMTEDTQKELVQLQRRILAVVQNYVKSGGKLIYSTCTINEDENEGNVRWFLKEHTEFRGEQIGGRDCLQLLPGTHKSDGFFIAAFRKE